MVTGEVPPSVAGREARLGEEASMLRPSTFVRSHTFCFRQATQAVILRVISGGFSRNSSRKADAGEPAVLFCRLFIFKVHVPYSAVLRFLHMRPGRSRYVMCHLSQDGGFVDAMHTCSTV